MSNLPLSVRINPHRLVWEKCCDHSSSFNFEWIFLILAYNKKKTIKAWMILNFVKIPLHILELAPLEHLKINE